MNEAKNDEEFEQFQKSYLKLLEKMEAKRNWAFQWIRSSLALVLASLIVWGFSYSKTSLIIPIGVAVCIVISFIEYLSYSHSNKKLGIFEKSHPEFTTRLHHKVGIMSNYSAPRDFD